MSTVRTGRDVDSAHGYVAVGYAVFLDASFTCVVFLHDSFIYIMFLDDSFTYVVSLDLFMCVP